MVHFKVEWAPSNVAESQVSDAEVSQKGLYDWLFLNGILPKKMEKSKVNQLYFIPFAGFFFRNWQQQWFNDELLKICCWINFEW